MFGLFFLRVLFVLIFSGVGYSAGGDYALVFAGLGFFGGVAIVFFEIFARRVSLKGLSSAVFGVLLGLLLSWVFGETLNQFRLPEELSGDAISNIKLFVTCVFVYLGLTLGIKGKASSKEIFLL